MDWGREPARNLRFKGTICTIQPLTDNTQVGTRKSGSSITVHSRTTFSKTGYIHIMSVSGSLICHCRYPILTMTPSLLTNGIWRSNINRGLFCAAHWPHPTPGPTALYREYVPPRTLQALWPRGQAELYSRVHKARQRSRFDAFRPLSPIPI